MKIGVIGIGEMGGTIARRWSEHGHRVRVANSRGPEAVKQFADEIGVRRKTCDCVPSLARRAAADSARVDRLRHVDVLAFHLPL
ncbi:MAG: hypothetical protein E6H68_11565 [Betaproteobacteria bacterium]|nr:MAG: hypothetical protein E6H68_11565 [Betaproteobacteria bacterium]